MEKRSKKGTASRQHSAASIQTEELLRARHVDFTFEPNLRLDGLVVSEGHQVRLIQNRAPQAMVHRYVQQMKAGAVFPAIVVNERQELIDGNTRRQAAIKSGKDTIAAYVCSGLTPLLSRSLSLELNQTNGLAMTDEEVQAFIRSAVHDEQQIDTAVYARTTGVRATTLKKWIAQARFEQRAERSGIPDEQVVALSPAVQAALDAVRLTPVLVAVTALAVEAHLAVTHVRQLIGRVNTTESEADALAIVAEEREVLGDVIRARAAGFEPPRPKSSRSAMYIGGLLKMTPDDLIDGPPEKSDERRQRLERLQELIDKALSNLSTEPRG